jgi:peptide deformylase
MKNPPTGRSGDHIDAGIGLHLRFYPDAVLRTVRHPIDRFDTWLTDLRDEMLALMRTTGGIGLAGPQVGILQRLFVAEIDRQAVCLVNPVITARSGSGRMEEGCLSLPGVYTDVQRAWQIEVQGFNGQGRKRTCCVEGLWARVMQHEIDHLDGVLICDRAHQGLEATKMKRHQEAESTGL